MPSYFCPHCGQTIDEDSLASAAETFDCPNCREGIRLADIAPEIARRNANRPFLEELVEETPPGGRIQCRQNGEELVIFIQPGRSGNTTFMGFFSIFWLGFMGIFTSAVIGSGEKDQSALPLFAIFIGIFWLIGFMLFYFWLKGRFGKTYILVERDRLVVRFVLLGREKIKEYVLTPDSRASLVESYQQNDRPVYAVSVQTAGKNAKFGTFLKQEEKQWIVDRINRHLP
jgi:hypothetical protein